MPDIRRERKEAAESLTEKKKILRTKKYYIFFLGITSWFLCSFCSVVSVLQNVLSLSLETNVQRLTIGSYSLCILMQKYACEVLDS